MEGSVSADVRRGQLLSDVLLGSGDEEECVKRTLQRRGKTAFLDHTHAH